MSDNWYISNSLLSSFFSMIIHSIFALIIAFILLVFDKFTSDKIFTIILSPVFRLVLSFQILAIFSSAIDTILAKMKLELKKYR